MAIVYSYPLNDNIKSLDELVGTTEQTINGQLKTVTRNFQLQSLANFFSSNGLQRAIYLTTENNTGAATFNNVTGALNIPRYDQGIISNVTGVGLITSTGGSTPAISTSMSTNRLVGRVSAGQGTFEEIILGTGLSFTGTTLNASASITPAALTKVDDTNVTLTLGGLPNTALLQNTSLTLGWTGTLADSRITSAAIWNAKQNAITTGTNLQYLRGDLSLATFPTNISSFTNDSGYITNSALTPYITSATAAATYEPKITVGTTSQYWRGDKTWQTFPTIPTVTPAALTKTDDTNVTLTLSGTPSAALLQTTGLTLGWTGVLSTVRGGTGLSALGTANQLIRVNSTATALEYFTPTTGGGITSLNALTTGTQTFSVGTTGSTFNISSSGSVHTFNIPNASSTPSTRGLLTDTDWSIFNAKVGLTTQNDFTNQNNFLVNSASFPAVTISNNLAGGGLFINTGTGIAAEIRYGDLSSSYGVRLFGNSSGVGTPFAVFNNTTGKVASISNSGIVTAASFVRTGNTGTTPSQILMADGSVVTAGTNITISGGTISSSGGGGSTGIIGYYGQYFSYTTQSATTNNIGIPMYFEVPDIYNGITVEYNGSAIPTNRNKITFANTGKYNLQFSTQLQNLGNTPLDVYIWLRKNGVTSAADVTGSTGVVGMEARKNIGDPYHTIVTWNFLLDITAGDFYQIIWATTDVTNVSIEFYTSTTNHPSTASTLFTVTQLANIAQTLQQVTENGATTTRPITVNANLNAEQTGITGTGYNGGYFSGAIHGVQGISTDGIGVLGNGVEVGVSGINGNGGFGVFAQNSAGGKSFVADPGLYGWGLFMDLSSSSTAVPISIRKATVETFKVDDSGVATANFFVKRGGLTTQTLRADGSTVTTGTLYKYASVNYQVSAGEIFQSSSVISYNIFSQGDVLRLNTVILFTAPTVNTSIVRFILNTSATTAGGTVIATYNMPVGSRYVPMDRFFWYIGGTLIGRDFSASASTSTSNSIFSADSIIFNSTTYYIIVDVITSGSDLAVISTFTIEKT